MGALLSFKVILVCLLRMELSVDQYIQSLNTIYGKFVTKNDDVASILMRDDVDSLVNLVATNKVTLDQYENCYEQGILHMAGSS